MPAVLGLAGACEALLRYMGDYQGDNYAYTLSPENGALKFATSQYNIKAANARQLDLEGQRGKVKKARIVYSQRGDDSAILTGQAAVDANLCDTPVTFEDKEVFVDITNATATRVLKFSNDDLNQICEDPQNNIDRWFGEELRIARQSLDKSLLTLWDAAAGKIISHTGADVNDGTNKDLKLISVNGTTSERTPVFSNFNQIKLDYRKMQLRGAPAIIGEGVIDEFFDLMGYACCNSSTPFADALRQSNNTAFFFDQNAEEVFGGEGEFLVMAPGSTMLLQYHENASLNINTELVKHFVMPDPEIPGLKWDVDFKWDECAKAYLWFAKLHWDLFNTFQPDSFASPDPLRGITGMFKYNGTVS